MARIFLLVGEWYLFASKNMVFIAKLVRSPLIGIGIVRELVCG